MPRNQTEFIGAGAAQCASCGGFMDPNRAHIEHIVPLSAGGTNERPNLRVLCLRCHLLNTAEAFSSISNIGGVAARMWVKAFSLAPKLTAASTGLVGAAVALGVTFSDPAGTHSPKPSEFADQVKVLDQTQRSLDQLSKFITSQRASVETEQKAIQRLQSQRRSLEPLVDADRKVVAALLLVQQQNAEKNARRERWIGFGLGVLGSILASAIFAAAGILIRKSLAGRKTPATDQEAD